LVIPSPRLSIADGEEIGVVAFISKPEFRFEEGADRQGCAHGVAHLAFGQQPRRA
jgi:hypothetical protein